MTLPAVTVEIAFNSQANPDAWTIGVSPFPTTFGDATIYVWTDVTAAANSISITRGKQRELDAYQVGRCLVDFRNQSRDFDPLNLSGPYVTGGVTDVRPGKPIRVKATDPATGLSYYLFRGTIRDWKLDYGGPFNATVQAQASDALADIATTSVSVVTSAAPSGTAVEEVLTAAGIGLLSADVGSTTLQTMTFSGTAGQALRVIEQTEQGHVFSDAEGGVSFRSRNSLISETRSNTSQATFGTATLPYEPLAAGDIAYDADAIKNHARVTRSGGALQESEDADSVAAYGEKLITLSGLANADDAAALALAGYLVLFRSEPFVRVASLTIAPTRGAAVLTAALSLRILDRVTVDFVPPGGSSPYATDVFIIGIEHKWAPPNAMRTTFRFMPTDAAGAGWLIGVSAFGVDTVFAY